MRLLAESRDPTPGRHYTSSSIGGDPCRTHARPTDNAQSQVTDNTTPQKGPQNSYDDLKTSSSGSVVKAPRGELLANFSWWHTIKENTSTRLLAHRSVIMWHTQVTRDKGATWAASPPLGSPLQRHGVQPVVATNSGAHNSDSTAVTTHDSTQSTSTPREALSAEWAWNPTTPTSSEGVAPRWCCNVSWHSWLTLGC